MEWCMHEGQRGSYVQTVYIWISVLFIYGFYFIPLKLFEGNTDVLSCVEVASGNDFKHVNLAFVNAYLTFR